MRSQRKVIVGAEWNAARASQIPELIGVAQGGKHYGHSIKHGAWA
jgi:hypothetical protein